MARRAMLLLTPPAPIPPLRRPSVFLAGSIDMGDAPRWQDTLVAALADTELTVLNPRRDDWDASWAQSIDDPRFCGQVEWELEGLERADLVAMVLDPGTRAPISLMELGLHAQGDRLVVCCPPGFWRKGNVDIVCRRYGVPVVVTIEALIDQVRARLVDASPRGPR